MQLVPQDRGGSIHCIRLQLRYQYNTFCPLFSDHKKLITDLKSWDVNDIGFQSFVNIETFDLFSGKTLDINLNVFKLH